MPITMERITPSFTAPTAALNITTVSEEVHKMKVIYEYTFADGCVMRFNSELPFSMLKLSVDIHHGLVKMRKIAEVEIK